MDAKNLLLAALLIIAIAYLTFWYTTVRRRRAALGTAAPDIAPTPLMIGIGFVTNFLDTLGIGSYATTTSMYKAWNIVRDEKIPGTLNVGHATATFVQALIYITIVEVEFTTLVTIIAAAMLGAWLGAGVVAGFDRRKVQLGMGIALFGAAFLMMLSLTNMGPAPGVALGISGAKLGLAFAISVVLGALMMLGIGYLRAVPDHDQPPGHGSQGCLPDHDGRLRVLDSRGQHTVHPQGAATTSRRRLVC